MDIQQHERTNQIKRLSKRLLAILTGVHYVLFLGWPALLYVALQHEGELKVGEYLVLLEQISPQAKAAILVLFAAGLLLWHRLNYHLRELMRCFSRGDIFNSRAIASVRGALNVGVCSFLLSLIHEAAGNYLAHTQSALVNFSVTTELVVAVVFFGAMFCLLWALEIGCDLNEESDLTI